MSQSVKPDGAAAEAEVIISAILARLAERTGCDFAGYRPATVHRRIRNRMISLGIVSMREYLELLEATEDESLRLLERITIKVSRFYRNPPTFDALRRSVLPALLQSRRRQPVRIWSAGCGCGEEAYTLAMLLEEAGEPGFIEASDLDATALDAARAGVYSPQALAELPSELATRFLEPLHAYGRPCYRVPDFLRRRVRFSHRDLTATDPAPGEGRFDLVCCRNVLIYLKRDLQERTLRAARGTLEAGGFLCLGEAEWPAALLATGSLAPLGRKTYIFRALDRSFKGEVR